MPTRADELRLVIDRVTREVTAQLKLVSLPWQPNPSAGFEGGFRYVGEADRPNLAVGMRSDGTPPPLWVRWRQTTAYIALVESRSTESAPDLQTVGPSHRVPL